MSFSSSNSSTVVVVAVAAAAAAAAVATAAATMSSFIDGEISKFNRICLGLMILYLLNTQNVELNENVQFAHTIIYSS